ncbi:tyrosine-type recombinase/integrase (plasmid) [Rubrobacter marinus]|uniref:Tyrosine-type recombinase/integrase n=1 Tax=Rubrobacter marinus TaxID=2653852 RepID=A0A6G8Q417_9ACTN|nr:tyrosine-type recombinase/integrase [Rubrobacter marinus]QIN81057.1 tyrosine-type recombinase/integrase [Rubrobacter marinus]
MDPARPGLVAVGSGPIPPDRRAGLAETGPEERARYLGEAVEFFLWSKGAGGRSDKTLADYRTKLEAFKRWAADGEGDVPLLYIDARKLESYLIHLKERGVPRADGGEPKPLSDSSRKAHLAVLRSFFSHRTARFGSANPAAALNDVRFRRRAPKRTYLTEREAGRLLAAAEREAKEAKEAATSAGDARARRAAEARRLRALRDHAAISAMLYAGLRIEEAAGLMRKDLRFDERGDDEVLVRGKGGKERRVPMHPKLRASLKRLVSALGPEGAAGDGPLFRNDRGGRITESSVRRRLYRYVRESRLRKDDLTPHDLRRTFATWYLAENPEGLRDLAELLGHSDLTQVMKYALSDEKRARAGVRRIGEGG